MKAFLLAAGLGKRLRPLTLEIPKPLVQVGGQSLIEWHIRKLAAMGIAEVIINAHWLAERLQEALGDGSRYGVRLLW